MDLDLRKKFVETVKVNLMKSAKEENAELRIGQTVLVSIGFGYAYKCEIIGMYNNGVHDMVRIKALVNDKAGIHGEIHSFATHEIYLQSDYY